VALPLAAVIRSSDRVAERQRQGTYHGDEDQLADVDRYCKARRLAYELLPPELDVSGGRPISERPSLRAAIEGVEAGLYSGIVAANLKRLTRSRSGLEIWERVEAAGGHVHTAAEAIDTSTPNGRFMRDIFLADAVREREEHAERHARRRIATVDAGMWRQRQVPLGYQFAGPVDGDGRYRGVARRLVPSAGADLVRWAFRQRAMGQPLVGIAEHLGMTPSGTRALLRNRLYLGELRDGDHVKVGGVPALIDLETFEAAQVSAPRPARTVADGPALLAGLVRCAGCGHVMTRSRTASLVYRCAGLHSGGRCPAPASITCATVDTYVEAIALAQLERLSVSDREGDAIQRAADAVADAEAELAAFLRATSFRDPGFEAALSERREAVEAVRAEMRAKMARQPVVSAPGRGAEVYAQADAVGRNRLLRGLLESVRVERCGRGRRVPVAERVDVVWFGQHLDVPDP
jgi:DNA invertase Pin-like site-specific DNA recombinase